MSQVIRAEDLESGVMFELSALGTVPLGQSSTTMDIVALQRFIRELYLNYMKPSGPQSLPRIRLVVSNRGLAVTDAPAGPQDRTPSAETLYNIPSVVFAAAVRFLVVGKKEKDFRCAFEAIDSEGPPANVAKGGKSDLYVPIDKKWKYLTKVTSHPAICACVIQRVTGGVKASELHAFVCESEIQARDVIFCLTSALKNFTAREAAGSSAIYGHGIYDLQPQIGGMRSEAEHLMMLQQQQARPPGQGEGVYGFQDQMMGYRGADAVARSGGGGQWDGRPPQGSSGSGEVQQVSEYVSQQRDQLMRNFSNDQRKNEPLRSQAEQGFYDQQRGVYDIQSPRVIYDALPSRGPFDAQQSKGIYDIQPAIYEYRPPQNQPEPPRDTYASGPPLADPYTLRRDIYDPTAASRAPPQLDPGSGNLYGPMRSMSGSSERVFDEPRRGQQDFQKPNVYDAQSRHSSEAVYSSGGGGSESEYKGFALPRVKVNYEETSPNARGELAPGGGGEYGGSGGAPRPSSGVYEAARLQKPQPTSSPYPSLDRRSPLPQRSKAQPPAPLAKTSRPSATSPTTDANPGLRSLGGGVGPLMKPESADRDESPAPMAAPKKVMGIKVFPTIMLRGNQAAAAAAAAADEDGETENGGIAGRHPSKNSAMPSSHFVDNLRSTKPNGTGPQPANRSAATDDQHGSDKRKKDEEIESALGGLSVDPSKVGRNPANDFEQSLGYLP